MNAPVTHTAGIYHISPVMHLKSMQSLLFIIIIITILKTFLPGRINCSVTTAVAPLTPVAVTMIVCAPIARPVMSLT